MALANLDEDASFEIKHGLLNDSVVEVDHVRRDLTLEVWILVHNRLKLILSEAISIDMVKCSVEEFRLIAEEVFVTTNDSLVAKLHVEIFLVGMTETNAVLAILFLRLREVFRDHIYLLINFFVFFKYVLLDCVEARLQIL